MRAESDSTHLAQLLLQDADELFFRVLDASSDAVALTRADDLGRPVHRPAHGRAERPRERGPEGSHPGGICTAIVKLAANLGLVSLAEGIETDAQRRFLIELGCGLGQGFLFSRAVPADEITSLLGSPEAASG